MKIWYSSYSLTPKKSLNALSGLARRMGALLRVEFSEALVGYADLHPHSELGDDSLQIQLKKLKQNQPSLLLNRSLHWALIDAHARKNECHLFSNLTLPKTHAVVTDLNALTIDQLLEWQQNGYTHIKIKMGRDLAGEQRIIGNLCEPLKEFQLRWDFNEILEPKQFDLWWKQISTLGLKTDYVEDPTPYAEDVWSCCTAPLALDHSLNLENLKTYSGAVVVFKAAVSDTHWLNNIRQRVVFSTYMDHPLGEMSAIFAAAQHHSDGAKPEVCGLRTWHLFEATEFSERLKNLGPELYVAEGTGFGFDDLLEKQPWKALT